jgi:hypothetical protein
MSLKDYSTVLVGYLDISASEAYDRLDDVIYGVI